MAAYAAVISLKNTIKRILEYSHISLVFPSPEILRLAFHELKLLQEILERLDGTSPSKSRTKVNALDDKIKDAVWKLEDLLESHLSGQILSQIQSPRHQLELTSIRNEEEEDEKSCGCEKDALKFSALDDKIKDAVWKLEDLFESHLSGQILFQIQSHRHQLETKKKKICGCEKDALKFSIDLQGMRQDVDTFVDKLKKMEKDYIHELDNLPDDDQEEEEESVGSKIDFGGTKSKMVGLSDQFEIVQRRLKDKNVSLIGMAGVGKTALAKQVFEDPLILIHFECRAWVRVGRKSKFNGISLARAILAELDPTNYKFTEGDERICEYLEAILGDKRCLIVLDDVWDKRILDDLTSFLPVKILRNIRILLTSRQRNIAAYDYRRVDSSTEVVRFLNEEESANLLCEKVFGKREFPSQLEKAAKKIAKKCEGLPLMIVTVASYLSNAEKTPEYWTEVAEKKNSVFVDAYTDISKVLFPSYEYLPQFLKVLFLYIGAFPQEYEISRLELINLLTVEGFLELSLEDCMEELDLWRQLVITSQTSRCWFMKICYAKKTCRLHSSWLHLCKVEASKRKIFHILNGRVDSQEEGIKGHRRLCMHSNNSLCFKEVYNSVKCDCASTTRSLLCFGPYHQYPVPINVGFKLLKILEALKVRFYHFPIEILQLVQLQYLALTCNKTLPASISKLFCLQFLIIHPHVNIKSCGAPSLIPVQIWDMQELKHIEIMGSCLPNPNCCASLKKLVTLLGVSASSCTSGVLEKIPNVTKLGIQIEWAPDDDSNPFSCFDHITTLRKLKTLKCSILNPVAKHGFVPPMTHFPTFPSGLQKLHLSGLGYPWECMKVIGSLPSLRVLKLRCYAFRGPNWVIESESFLSLEFLLIEDTDLVQWRPGPGSFRSLSYLSMKHCYKLEELHWPSVQGAKRIELVDCNPLAVDCAEQLKRRLKRIKIRLDVVSSFKGGKKSNDD